ncbi:methyltransferase domain-containing protein [bacterium]|nr:methyltransferase domain-containing protein [bacterium]
MKKTITKNGFDFSGKVCLELGPGNSYINAYNLLMNGAKKVILIDKFPRHLKTKKQKEFFRKELDYIKKKYNLSELFFIRNGKIRKQYIEFIRADLVDTHFKEKVDFILTVSVLEHVKKVEKVVTKLSKILKKNGMMYHWIDLRDHYNFSEPFLFYKYSKRAWEKYLTKEGVSYTNRLRYDDFLKLFKKYGFKILNQKIKRFPLNLKKMNQEFENKNNLDVGILEVILQK